MASSSESNLEWAFLREDLLLTEVHYARSCLLHLKLDLLSRDTLLNLGTTAGPDDKARAAKRSQDSKPAAAAHTFAPHIPQALRDALLESVTGSKTDKNTLDAGQSEDSNQYAEASEADASFALGTSSALNPRVLGLLLESMACASEALKSKVQSGVHDNNHDADETVAMVDPEPSGFFDAFVTNLFATLLEPKHTAPICHSVLGQQAAMRDAFFKQALQTLVDTLAANSGDASSSSHGKQGRDFSSQVFRLQTQLSERFLALVENESYIKTDDTDNTGIDGGVPDTKVRNLLGTFLDATVCLALKQDGILGVISAVNAFTRLNNLMVGGFTAASSRVCLTGS
jgi:hypothetical protein